MAFGFEAPLTADARMQDLLQRAFLFRVGEYYRAHFGPIQAAIGRKNLRAKLLPDQLPHLGVPLREVVGRLVRVKEGCCGNEFAQALRKSRFSGGDPTRNPNGRHAAT